MTEYEVPKEEYERTEDDSVILDRDQYLDFRARRMALANSPDEVARLNQEFPHPDSAPPRTHLDAPQRDDSPEATAAINAAHQRAMTSRDPDANRDFELALWKYGRVTSLPDALKGLSPEHLAELMSR